jgi:ABC-type transport system involved in cytochrome bd biosynthesis fused ATPase/permease subunit
VEPALKLTPNPSIERHAPASRVMPLISNVGPFLLGHRVHSISRLVTHTMSFNLAIPKPDGSSLAITLGVGQCIFVLGANGTGKSSLMQRLYTAHHGKEG